MCVSGVLRSGIKVVDDDDDDDDDNDTPERYQGLNVATTSLQSSAREGTTPTIGRGCGGKDGAFSMERRKVLDLTIQTGADKSSKIIIQQEFGGGKGNAGHVIMAKAKGK